jgi:SAM-dependent methyltransferase
MGATTSATGSAGRHGDIWGARARDWAENEEQQVPTYEDALRHVALEPGATVLEVGCGSGVFLRLATDRGFRVSGLDASEALIELACERVPEADLEVGDLQFLPYDDDSFDLVCGFNSFFFAADLVAALREAGRVAKPGGNVLAQVWGRPDRCDLTPMKEAVAPFMPPPPPGASGPPPLWQPGVLEALATEAGLEPRSAFDLSYAFEYADEATLARRLLAPGLIVEAIRASGEEAVRRAIVGSLAAFRRPDGSYSLSNEWHFLVASAP